jgi:DNA invertase Pin-like site-specific DNA recombinase
MSMVIMCTQANQRS